MPPRWLLTGIPRTKLIRNLDAQGVAQFTGKNLAVNLAAMAPGDLLAAGNVQILGDGVLRTMPGYALVQALGSGPVAKIFDFQRAVDQRQFVFVQHGGKIGVIQAAGNVAEQVLSNGESEIPYSFVKNAFNAYGSDGINAWKFCDNAGTLTKYKWGITPPATAPGITITGSSSLTLTYGRQYVYCYVSEITDSLGIVRTSVSAPSPMSAFTGPVTNQVVDVLDIIPSTDAQVTKIWVFATYDGAYQTQSAFYFAAEIAATATSWADTLPNTALDDTRQAPFSLNNPPPACAILVEFQSRIWALTNEYIQYSGFEEILLGIPEESWPPLNYIAVPSGARQPTAGLAFDGGTNLLISTIEFFMSVTGYDATTITSQDRVLSPGCVGKKALCNTPTHMMWIGRDKRLWAWNGISSSISDIPVQAMEFSYPVSIEQPGTLSMNDLTDDQLANAELKYFSYGQEHYIILFANTKTDGSSYYNWWACWQVNMQKGQISSVIPTDKFPAHQITATANVLDGSTYSLFVGDVNGNIYQWPSGFTDAGTNIAASFSTGWLTGESGPDMVKNFKWVDLIVDDPAAFIQKATYSAVARMAPDMAAALVQLKPMAYPVLNKQGQQLVRVKLNVGGVSVGKYFRLLVTMPADGTQHTVSAVNLASRPRYKNTV